MSTIQDTQSAAPVAVPQRLWRVAGALAIAHAVLILAGISLESSALFDEGVDGIREQYVDGNLTRTLIGGYIELVGFVLLVPVIVLLARVLGRRTETGRWAAQSALIGGIGYIVLTFSPGLAAGAVAIHAAQNGVDVETAWVLNNLRVITYAASLMLLGTHAIGVGISALSDRTFTRWIGWGGIVVGIALFVSTPLLAWNLHDYGTLVWLVWWIGMAVCLLRHRDADHRA